MSYLAELISMLSDKGETSHMATERHSSPRRTLSDKERQDFMSQRNKYLSMLDMAWTKVEQLLPEVTQGTVDFLQLRQQEKSLAKRHDVFMQHSADFVAFLSRVNSKESEVELDLHVQIRKTHNQIVDQAKSMLDIQIQRTLEAYSQRTHSSKPDGSRNSVHSSKSMTSSVLTHKRAQADAARARVEYTAKETDLRKQRAVLTEEAARAIASSQRQKSELDAELVLLKEKKEAAVAQAEIRAIEHSDRDNRSSSRSKVVRQLPEQSSYDRTSQYVRELPLPYSAEIYPPDINTVLHQDNENNKNSMFTQPKEPVGQNDSGTIAVTSEITRFLLKKELLLSRLTKYNDQPESYSLWKSGFRNIVKELHVTPVEELDFSLNNWLGPESAKNASSIRMSNANNPTLGLKRLWDRLDERYGSPEMVEAALKKKLADFPKLSNKDHHHLYELSDILSEIESTKEDERYKPLLAYFDSSTGINPVVRKLPYGLQEKWTTTALKYKKDFKVSFPPFNVFAEFIRDISKAKNDPSFAYEVVPPLDVSKKDTRLSKPAVSSRKTEVSQQQKDKSDSPDKCCPLHQTNHSFNNCKAFRTKSMRERKDFLKNCGICFRCCASKDHMFRACKEAVQCAECQSDGHPTALHCRQDSKKKNYLNTSEMHGGEGSSQSTPVTSNCTEICGENFSGKSCAKTVLVNVYPEEHPEKSYKMYAILDDQSNMTLAKSRFFDLMQIKATNIPFTLSSCAGSFETSGRRATGYIIEPVDKTDKLRLKTLIECNHIPDIRSEIPTPEVAQHYSHLQEIAKHIPLLDNQAEILLLIGRDVLEAHHVQDQRIGLPNTPYAQKLRLGWVIVGESCLHKVHRPDIVDVKKTQLLHNGRQSIFHPCPNSFSVREVPMEAFYKEEVLKDNSSDLGDTIFKITSQDDKIGTSVEDRDFLQMMDKEFLRDPNSGKWIAPLPFRSPRQRLPNNRPQAAKRAQTLPRSLQRDPVKKQHFKDFMQRIIDSGHAEIAPPLDSNEECWYLPIFGVYHPKKPGQIPAVFDSSAQYQGISLNNILLTGPDLTNSLLGILLRFRREHIAITADVQQMFYNFMVKGEHRNFLRFLWYRDNDLDQDLVEYRMTVHVFGNSPSPAIATYGMRRAVDDEKFGEDVTKFVSKDFYVDDGLTSLPQPQEAIDLMKRTQKALHSGGNIRLHKVASNSAEVVGAFSEEDLAKDLKNLDFDVETLPVQRSLGLMWNLETDTFTYQVSEADKPFTKRGILSTVNSLFDPLGFVAPVVIQGKIILREAMTITSDWDEILPSQYQAEWENWKDALNDLKELNIPRPYSTSSIRSAVNKEIHIFADASEKVVAAVAFLKTNNQDGEQNLGFVMGKSKVAPRHGHTIPRLELCAAVLAVELAETLFDQLDITFNSLQFYTDSKIVLGYTYNQSRRFHVYVANRVERIRKFSQPEQWHFVSSNENPADVGTKGLCARDIANSRWLQGPACKLQSKQDNHNHFPLVDHEVDKEIRPETVTLKNTVTSVIGTHRFERFSSWSNLVRAFMNLLHVARSYRKDNPCHGWHICLESKIPRLYKQTEVFLLKCVQQELFQEEFECIQAGRSLPKSSPLRTLNPVIDEEGLLRVGGRLARSDLPVQEKHPVIIPGRHHIGILLIRHYHDKVRHQGRHFTEGAIRAAGYWLVGGRRLISSVLYKCIKCRKLRGKLEIQKMADLPTNRLKPGPAFSNVGIDTFGPWNIVARRTRGGQANAKRWAILFTCLTTRAVHIEVIEDMGSSSFINALRRFIAVRGKVTEFRSDRGTNFVGATDSLQINAINVEDGPVKNFLFKEGAMWIFNSPHASHMGGVWERMIGVTRRILDSMMSSEIATKNLTHEVLSTLMAEVSAIINARPIVPVSSDPEAPEILSPAMLLTMKSDQVTAPSYSWNIKDMYKAEWRRVQTMADMFWKRWRIEFLHTLQPRRKWNQDKPNLKTGDIVLLKDKSVHRNQWPMGIVVDPIPSSDSKVRKITLRIVKDGKSAVYLRPLSEIVFLWSPDSSKD